MDVRAREINERMKIAAAQAIASLISETELNPDYIIPDVFDSRVAPAIAAAVARAAVESGVARRHLPPEAVAQHTRELYRGNIKF